VIPFLGLTGGIGAGKSTALAELERLGCATLSTDAVVHSLYSEPPVVNAVVERFGGSVAPEGVVDRAALALAAFGTPEDRAWLEGLLWPLVGERMVSWRERVEHAEPAPRAAVVEVPLLFESGMEAAFDATIRVVSDEAVRHERAAARGHQALDERAARQLTQAEKAARATYVVPNDGTVEELGDRLSTVLGMLKG
jgi:dephospho-CoA kinase